MVTPNQFKSQRLDYIDNGGLVSFRTFLKFQSYASNKNRPNMKWSFTKGLLFYALKLFLQSAWHWPSVKTVSNQYFLSHTFSFKLWTRMKYQLTHMWYALNSNLLTYCIVENFRWTRFTKFLAMLFSKIWKSRYISFRNIRL